ncbi:MAG: undecaprenyldiphospho-muramoylpentapeptide beta-N-acetylglucosaminyltransferase [Deltaproteobacteria bacterium]|nr:undecaprenyldiphospho-muramoylpentapeptide beta-N-acetylglucosaminyltransferase [Deltaproteobacteria bacterium]
MRVLIAGGGTGGHVFPALSIAEAIKAIAPEAEVAFAGRREGLEMDVFSEKGHRFYPVSAAQVRGKGLAVLWSAIGMLRGVIDSARILMRFKPDIVVGVGGYVSFPVGIATVLLGKKMVLHEQNSVPGSTNRFLGRFAVKVFTGFAEAGAFFKGKKVIYSGNPVRHELVARALRKKAESEGTYNILVLGGSAGAVRLNALALELVGTIKERGLPFKVYHQTGKKNYERMAKEYEQYGDIVHFFSFTEDIGEFYDIADFVVARAGAVTISEIACFGVPAVLIPYPYAADGHQEKNALVYVRNGCGLMMKEDEVSKDKILDFFLDLTRDDGRLRDVSARAKTFSRPFAADEIARTCIDLV